MQRSDERRQLGTLLWCAHRMREVLSGMNGARTEGVSLAAMYLASRWRTPGIAAQPRNLLEKYSGALHSRSACSMITVHCAQHESTYAAPALTCTLLSSADTVCPEQKVIHTTCPACECRIKDKVRAHATLQVEQQQHGP